MVDPQYVAFAEIRERRYHPDMDEIERCRENMLRAMRDAGLNPNKWAKLAGVSESGVRGFLSGDSPNISLKYLSKLAEVVGRRSADFLCAELLAEGEREQSGEIDPRSSPVDSATFDEAARRVRMVFAAANINNSVEEAKAVAHVYHQLMSGKNRC